MVNLSDTEKVSVPFRVAAWVLSLGSLATLIKLLVRILGLGTESRSEATISALTGTFGLVVFGYVALTGRAPAFFKQLKDAWSDRFGTRPSSRISTRVKLLRWIVALVISTALIWSADASALFDDRIRGLVLLAYAISAVALVLLVWRLFRVAA